MWGRTLDKIGNWLKKDGEEAYDYSEQQQWQDKQGNRPGALERPSMRVVPELPRPITFHRQNSERRERLQPHEPCLTEKRAVSVDRRQNAFRRQRTPSLPPVTLPSLYAPNVQNPRGMGQLDAHGTGGGSSATGGTQDSYDAASNLPTLDRLPSLSLTGPLTDRDDASEALDELVIEQELDAKWILNLSMHFRDMSDREKFFITYAEEPNRWRRVTVSCDYRNVSADSLEAELKSLHYQRDKSAQIYKAIRDSLPAIQFYPTVTNLKLQTDDGRLHVHVTEDVNEIIPYPPVSVLEHLRCRRFKESTLQFESHLSGFVYKVNCKGVVYIKKEIPGPDAVEEFLYEINALNSLQRSKSVITFEGIIIDDSEALVKGLLISYAEQGALVDLIYDLKGTAALPWRKRERWAKQIVQGLSEIHESGFVQGDFTLSNIVVDGQDDAKIIDINRRGCPVGWEPSELSERIRSGQRISIYIGVKSDLFQLGMVLWALAEEQDEPERQERPLMFSHASDGVPQYFQDAVQACLSDDPRDRISAKDLLATFPQIEQDHEREPPVTDSRHSLSTHRSDKEYIDPATAVGLRDIDEYRQRHAETARSDFSTEDITFVDGAISVDSRFNSSGSYIVGRRGRSPASRRERRYDDSPFARPVSDISLDDSELDRDAALLPPSREPLWERVYVDGNAQLVHRSSYEVRHANESAPAQPDICFATPPAGVETRAVIESALDTTSRSLDTSRSVTAAVSTSDSPTPSRADAALPAELPSCPASLPGRAFQLRRADDSSLEGFDDEVASDVSLDPPARAFSFGPPSHQDSGFHELPPEVAVLDEKISGAEVATAPGADTSGFGVEGVELPSCHAIDNSVGEIHGPSLGLVARKDNDECMLAVQSHPNQHIASAASSSDVRQPQ